MINFALLPSPVQTLHHPLFLEYGIDVFIKRDDLIHPIISGNKWRKLKGNLSHAKQQKKKGVLSFGGAYSNHIHALAYACHQQSLSSIGIIRGEPHYQDNFTLGWAQHWDMKLNFVDRASYRLRHQSDYLDELQSDYPDYLIVPEGGSNALAISGVAEIVDELKQQQAFDTLMLPVGSGGTIAGLLSACQPNHQLLGVAVLKNAEYLVDDIVKLSPTANKCCWQLLTEYHGGGYAKYSIEDAARLAEFITQTGIAFEPVYSGKMVLALLDLIKLGHFPRGHKVMLLHTGGLQGIGGQLERNLMPDVLAKALQSHLPSAPPAR